MQSHFESTYFLQLYREKAEIYFAEFVTQETVNTHKIGPQSKELLILKKSF
jgi:hypothetical protein